MLTPKTDQIAAPMALLAELTYRCPMQCSYCSNPIGSRDSVNELTTEQWHSVFQEAQDLGVLQVHLSGGEPLLRNDLNDLIQSCSQSNLYSNLITSGITLSKDKLIEFKKSGLNHLQLSIPAPNEEVSYLTTGYRNALEQKIKIANYTNELQIPLTINTVIHKDNIDLLPEIIELAITLKARRLEIAHTQYHGIAYQNKEQLLPSLKQLEKSIVLVEKAKETLNSQLQIDHVIPDYYAKYPKACMGGWGRVGLNITPSGKVLPCHAAETIKFLQFENVQNTSLSSIWFDSDSFNQFRGTEWMPERCKTCERKNIDFGGCRCQAMSVTGNANETDPACYKSPFHDQLVSK